MARKNLLASVTKLDAPQESEGRAEDGRRGEGSGALARPSCGMSKVRQAERRGQCEGFSRKPPKFAAPLSGCLMPASLKGFASPP